MKEGKVDCGFLRTSHARGIESVPYETDEMLAVLPEGHPLVRLDAVPVSAFLDEPFLTLEHGTDTEVAELFEKEGVSPDIALSTWDDYAIMAMVEKGLGLANCRVSSFGAFPIGWPVGRLSRMRTETSYSR